MFSHFVNALRSDLALYVSSDRIYLGTHTKLLAEEAACIALHKDTRRALAIGNEALAMEGREPRNIEVVRPFRLGMVWDQDAAEACFRYLFKKHAPRKLVTPRLVLSGHCQGDAAKRAFKDTLTGAGASEVMLLEAGMAAAMGLGLKIEAPEFNIILNLERDWLEISVISLAGVAAQSFAPIGFADLLENIALYAHEALSLDPDLRSLEASVRSSGFTASAELIGWKTWTDSLENGSERAGSLSPEAIAQACAPTLLRLRRVLALTIEQLPKEKRMLLTAAPIHLAGGFSDVAGLPALLGQRLNRNVKTRPNSARAAYDGTAMVLAELNELIPFTKKAVKEVNS